MATLIKEVKLFTCLKGSINVKKRLFKICVWSKALYGCETWMINKTKRKVLEALSVFQLKGIRSKMLYL